MLSQLGTIDCREVSATTYTNVVPQFLQLPLLCSATICRNFTTTLSFPTSEPSRLTKLDLLDVHMSHRAFGSLIKTCPSLKSLQWVYRAETSASVPSLAAVGDAIRLYLHTSLKSIIINPYALFGPICREELDRQVPMGSMICLQKLRSLVVSSFVLRGGSTPRDTPHLYETSLVHVLPSSIETLGLVDYPIAMYNEVNQLVGVGLSRLNGLREVRLGRVSGHGGSDSTKRSIAEDALSCVP